MIVLRVPYPLGFYAKGFDGRIDDPERRLEGPRPVGGERRSHAVADGRRQGHASRWRRTSSCGPIRWRSSEGARGVASVAWPGASSRCRRESDICSAASAAPGSVVPAVPLGRRQRDGRALPRRSGRRGHDGHGRHGGGRRAVRRGRPRAAARRRPADHDCPDQHERAFRGAWRGHRSPTACASLLSGIRPPGAARIPRASPPSSRRQGRSRVNDARPRRVVPPSAVVAQGFMTTFPDLRV